MEKTLRWLCRTPLGEQVQQRSIANAFVLEWLAGTPEITVDINTLVLPMQEEYPELLFSLIHGMALYMLDHPKEKNPVKLHTEGLKVVAGLIAQSKELSGERQLRKIVRLAGRNKLRGYVEEQMQAGKR